MENLKNNLFSRAFPLYSSYLLELLIKTSKFCSQVQQQQKSFIRLEKKLGIYEKFQNLNRLSQIDLERLEKHFFRGIDIVKEERIKRKYQEKILELQTKLHENPMLQISTIISNSENENLNENCEDLMNFIKKYDKIEEEIPEFTKQIPEKPVSTAKKTRNLSIKIALEDTVKDWSNSNENLLTKVSSFGEDGLMNHSNQSNKGNGLFVIQNILNSQNLETEINDKIEKNESILAKEENSPDFSLAKTKANPLKKPEFIEKEANLSMDFTKKKEKRNYNRNMSICGLPLQESLDFSFHFDKKEEIQREMMNSERSFVKENQYLKKLTNEIAKKK